ncbi:magnesium transporter [Tistrella sp. BH-R2-4]|uniref:Magnesium transporter MgtE n=1 Tax=Tistrella arctica TaxID=3133430 RepID=A0ABU9YN19_9PROT
MRDEDDIRAPEADRQDASGRQDAGRAEGGAVPSLYGVSDDLVRRAAGALDEGDAPAVRGLVAELHAADIADLLERLSGDERRSLVELLRDGFDPEILPHLAGNVRDQVIAQLGPRALAEALSVLDSDDAIYLIEDLDDDIQAALLATVPPATRRALEESLAYPEYSAGRLMQRDLIAMPAFWTVGRAIDFLRETPDLPEEFYEIFVVDPRHKPIGAVPLARMLRHPRKVLLRDIMDRDVDAISASVDQEEVARLFRHYSLASAPVVDDQGRLIGVITFDDVVDVIQEEAEEDMALMAGVGSEVDVNAGLVRAVRQRMAWLGVNLGTALMVSSVIALFEATIEQIVALAVLMPIVASMGGNAGTQTLTVAVRALALKELTPSNAMRIVMRETGIGAINGLVFGIAVGVAAGLIFDPFIGAVLFCALFANMLTAGLSGMLIPLALDRLKVDPAVSAGVFLTAVTDIVGFFAFLGLAQLVLL